MIAVKKNVTKRRLLAAKIFDKIKVGDFITRSPTFSILRLGKYLFRNGCIDLSHP